MVNMLYKKTHIKTDPAFTNSEQALTGTVAAECVDATRCVQKKLNSASEYGFIAVPMKSHSHCDTTKERARAVMMLMR